MDVREEKHHEIPGPEMDGMGQDKIHSEIEDDDETETAGVSSWEKRRCPSILRMTPNSIQLTAAFIGIIAGIALSFAIFKTAAPGSVAGRLFNFNSIQGLLPMAMTGMFFWGIVLCLMRFIRIRHVEKVTKSDLIADLERDIRSFPHDQLLSKLEHSRIADGSPLLRRLRIVLRQWLFKPDLQGSLSLLNQQAVSDAEDIQHAYGVVKTFVWALPVLGLVGTVIGIALAVGDFGTLLGGNVDDVAVIKSSLVQVTAGLSFAFTTTLLGLLGALLLVLPSSALQAREEKLITKMDGLISDQFLPELQRLYPEQSEQEWMSDETRFKKTLERVAETTVQTAGRATIKVLDEAEARFGEWHGQILAANQEVAGGLSEAAAKIGKELGNTSEEFMARLSQIRESIDQQVESLRKDIEQRVTLSMQIADKLDASVEKHDDAITEASSMMQKVVESSKELSKNQEVLAQSIKEMTGGAAAKSLESLTNSISDAVRQQENTLSALDAMTEATRSVTDFQKSLQNNLERMESMGLGTTLDNLGKTLDHVSEVLMRFQEPIVFQAVRVSSVLEKENEGPVQRNIPASLTALRR